MAREILPNLSELIDRMTISQIKIVKLENDKSDFKNELIKISKDIDLLLKEGKIFIDAKILRLVSQLSQLNIMIWQNKEEMQNHLEDEDTYLKLLKLAHQLNGYRNQIKNALTLIEGGEDKSAYKSNFETDGLEIEFDL